MAKTILVGFASLILSVAAYAQAPQPNPQDPQYQAKGDQKRTYAFPGTGESIPYHLYVPAKWDKTTRLPLVVVTHGASQPADAPFQRGNGALGKIAEERGYVVVAVTGYKPQATVVDGGYNNPFKMVPAPRPAAAASSTAPRGGGGGRGPAPAPATKEDFERSEMDILYVTDLVAKEYNTDPNRTYLMGNSAGGGALWYLAQKYPERWTAISPSAGPLTPEEFPYAKIKNIPVLAVHGDQDTTMSYDASKQMVELAKKAGVDATFLGVPGGSHTEAWTQVLPQTFDFFEKHKTKKK